MNECHSITPSGHRRLELAEECEGAGPPGLSVLGAVCDPLGLAVRAAEYQLRPVATADGVGCGAIREGDSLRNSER